MFNFEQNRWFHFQVTWSVKKGVQIHVDGILRAEPKSVADNSTRNEDLIMIGDERSSFEIDELEMWDGLKQQNDTHFILSIFYT